ncbi:hypothetical protein SAMN05421757_101767 [Tropicimonas sediminicola]|uniref:Uncharacterized protein n=2 Tax=Tropicimonas sediminicola TaxID=1031541 RepID=A0A239DDX9_9RHOB|nr:hypothetical protein SAMN05421757_101767 [Tropicimonas sediminicola]
MKRPKEHTNPMLIRSLSITAILLCLLSPVHAEQVEITLVDDLDGDLNSYCLDISGPQEQAAIDGGLQSHTCYSYQGALGVDQIFASERLAENVLYMPEFDVCATAAGLDAGAELGLATCNDSAAQKIALTAEGKLSPVDAPGMCYTAGAETRLGRGGTSRHQIKSLTLEPCSDDLAAFQTWRARSSDD